MNHLYIKNMVCNRCIRVVKEELEKLSIVIKKISLGEVETESIINKETLEIIREMLEQNGFELIEDKKVKIIEKVKNIIIETIYGNEEFLSVSKNFSKLLEKEIGLDYRYMSTLFSSLESITIEQYIIIQKIERAKEFLKYGELTLSEIAYKLGYSSVQHLSNQFKKITGFSASEFKNITQNMRRPIDKLS
ncbi:MAG: helix-turn-helix transcriptional regulator [Ignavibacteriales bacterium]|nr:helix-turn-helix transcriptional regulator [Ignavibacteriales bacterium]